MSKYALYCEMTHIIYIGLSSGLGKGGRGGGMAPMEELSGGGGGQGGSRIFERGDPD